MDLSHRLSRGLIRAEDEIKKGNAALCRPIGCAMLREATAAKVREGARRGAFPEPSNSHFDLYMALPVEL